jgi:hypothetical protein
MKLHWIVALLFLGCSLVSEAVRLPSSISNQVFSETIGTVKLHREGWALSNPVIELNSDQKLLLSFDDLANVRQDYYYTLYHCNRNWSVSAIAQQEYLPSFTDFPVNDFAYSINTKVGYINYQVRIPNDDVPIKFSGNYALVIFNRNEPDLPVLIRRFFVVENRVSVDARIRRALFEKHTGENQEVDIRVNHHGFPIQNPFADVKLVVLQNGRDDNALTELKPVYVQNEMLDYDYDQENVFVGGNEFRYFEIRGIKYPGEGVLDVRYIAPLYHVTLESDQVRVNKRYNYYREMNGRFHVEAYNMQEPDIEADYLMVHFTLPMENVLMGGGIYIFGELTNWQCLPEHRMKWNPEMNRYELDLLLKQGYYNYMYAWMDDQDKLIKPQAIEGSNPDAENDYQVFFYYGRKADRYDRLVGYQQFNSHLNRTFKY